MNDVARAVGISKPSIYHHFENKEQLFIAVATDGPARSTAVMRQVAADPALSSRDKLARALDAIYDGLVRSAAGQMMPLVAETSTRFPAIARFFRDGFIAEMDEIVRAILREGIARGELTDGGLNDFIDLLFAPPVMLSLSRAMFSHLPDSPEYAIEPTKDDHLKIIFKVLTPE